MIKVGIIFLGLFVSLHTWAGPDQPESGKLELFSSESQKSQLEQVPAELTGKLGEFLHASDQFELGRASHSCSHQVRSNRYFPLERRLQSYQEFVQLLSEESALNWLNISNVSIEFSDIRDLIALRADPHNSRIKRLSFYFPKLKIDQPDNFFKYLFENFPDLVSIRLLPSNELLNAYSRSMGPNFHFLKNLEQLDLDQSTFQSGSFESILAGLKTLNTLKRLNLSISPMQYMTEGPVTLSKQGEEDLKEVIYSNPGMKEINLSGLGILGGYEWNQPSQNVLLSLRNLTHLETLILNNTDLVHPRTEYPGPGLAQLADVVPYLPNLKKLSVNFNPNTIELRQMNPSLLIKALHDHNPALIELHMEGIPLTDSVELLQGLPLESLTTGMESDLWGEETVALLNHSPAGVLNKTLKRITFLGNGAGFPVAQRKTFATKLKQKLSRIVWSKQDDRSPLIPNSLESITIGGSSRREALPSNLVRVLEALGNPKTLRDFNFTAFEPQQTDHNGEAREAKRLNRKLKRFPLLRALE